RKTSLASFLSASVNSYFFLSTRYRRWPLVKYLPFLNSSCSHASSPLKRQLHDTVSVQFSGGDDLSGPPLPYQLPMYSFRACRASLAGFSSSPARNVGANRNSEPNERTSRRFMDFPQGKLWGRFKVWTKSESDRFHDSIKKPNEPEA